MYLQFMLVLLALSVSTTECGLARFLTRGFVDNSCERALRTTVSSNCMGNSSCANFINLHFPECSEEVDRVLAQNVFSSSDGLERLICDATDPIQALSCQYYCRLKHRPNGVCSETDNLPTCECNGWTKEPSNQCLQGVFYDRTLAGHSARIVALAALSNGDLASASLDQTIKIWDGCDGRLKLTMASPPDGVSSMTAIGNGQLAIGSFDGSIMIRDTADGALMATLEAQNSPVTALAKVNSSLASGYRSGFVKLWNVTSLSEIWSVRVHSDLVTALIPINDGTLVSASLDSNVTILNARNGSISRTLVNSNSNAVRSMAADKNRKLIIEYSNGVIRTWFRVWSRHQIRLPALLYLPLVYDLTVSVGQISSLAVLDNSLLAIGFDDSIKIRTLGLNEPIVTIPERGDMLTVLNSRNLAAVDGKVIKVWNPRIGMLKMRISRGFGPSFLVVLENGDLAFPGFQNGFIKSTIDIINTYGQTRGNLESKRLSHFNSTSEFISATVLKNGYLAGGNENGSIVIWDASKGQIKHSFRAHNSSIQALAVLPNGNLVSGSSNGTIRIWDNGTLKHTLSEHRLRSLAVLNNGDLASASSSYKTIHIWNPVNGDLKRSLTAHEDEVHCLAVLPTGELVSGSVDKTIKIWDTSRGAVKRSVTIETGHPTSLAVLPDGYLACGTSEGDISIWDPFIGTLKRTISVRDGCSELRKSIDSLAVLRDGSLASVTSCGVQIWSLY